MLSETLTGLHVKHPLLLSDFNAALIFSRFSKKSSNIKSHAYPMEAKTFHADGRTDGRTHDEANDRLSQFCERA
jgi:hypothetical protein